MRIDKLIDGRSVRRIAVLRALYLGDLLMTVPAFRALRRAFPEAEVTLIGLPWAAELVRRFDRYVDRHLDFPGFPGIIEVPVVPDRTAAFLAEQRARCYDLAIQMHGDGSVSNGFIAELGAAVTLGYAPSGDRRLTHALPFRERQNEVLRWLELVAELGAPADDASPEFPLREPELERAAAMLEVSGGGPLVGLHAGAKDLARRWPAERFAALGDRLAERYGARIVLTGAAAERELVDSVAAAMRAPALNLAGRTDIAGFAAAIAQLDLLVTNDTGASHLAAATRTPSVVLFGPTRPQQFAPLDATLHRPIDALDVDGSWADPAEALARLPVEHVLTICDTLLEDQQCVG